MERSEKYQLLITYFSLTIKTTLILIRILTTFSPQNSRQKVLQSRISVSLISSITKLIWYTRTMSDVNPDKTLQFCNEMGQVEIFKSEFINICFSDRSEFYLNGLLNKHNFVIPWKIKVYYDILRNHIAESLFGGHFFYNRNYRTYCWSASFPARWSVLATCCCSKRIFKSKKTQPKTRVGDLIYRL